LLSNPNRAIIRMFDANANRASEGLRTVEDVMRFCYENSRLSKEARSARHAVAKISVRIYPRSKLLSARDAGGDVGSRRSRGAMRRGGIGDLIFANMRRAQESVRVMEEIARRAASPGDARALQSLRFRLYRLERAVWSFARSH
jgi:thiamine-phosphate pyrophosphorylase